MSLFTDSTLESLSTVQLILLWLSSVKIWIDSKNHHSRIEYSMYDVGHDTLSLPGSSSLRGVFLSNRDK